MKTILTETEVHQLRRSTVELLLSPQGRTWARPLLTERGKGAEGSMVQIRKELLDLLNDALVSLYEAPAPVTGR